MKCTPVVKSGNCLGCAVAFSDFGGEAPRTGDKWIPGQYVSELSVWSLGDSDAGRQTDVFAREPVIADPKAAARLRQVASIVAGASDAERLGQTAWAAGEQTQIARILDRDSSRTGHRFDSGERLESPEENASGLPFGLTGNIQAVMIAVDEVHVDVAGRAEQYFIAQGASGKSMRGRIVLPQIGFYFNDPGSEARFVIPVPCSNQHFAEQIPRNPAWIAGEKLATDWADQIEFTTESQRNGERQDGPMSSL